MPLRAETSALDLTGLDLLLVPEDTVFKPPTRVLRIAAIVDPDLTCCAEVFTIPISYEAVEASHVCLTGYVKYLGDATVDSAASGDEIAFQLQEQFSTVPLDLHMMIFVLNHDEGGGCAKTFYSIGSQLKESFFQSNETCSGAWTGLAAWHRCFPTRRRSI